MPVEEIDISSDELALQIAYEKQYPSLETTVEFMLAQLTANFVAANSKRGKTIKISDYMLTEKIKSSGQKQVTEEMKLKNQLLQYQAQRDRMKEKDGE